MMKFSIFAVSILPAALAFKLQDVCPKASVGMKQTDCEGATGGKKTGCVFKAGAPGETPTCEKKCPNYDHMTQSECENEKNGKTGCVFKPKEDGIPASCKKCPTSFLPMRAVFCQWDFDTRNVTGCVFVAGDGGQNTCVGRGKDVCPTAHSHMKQKECEDATDGKKTGCVFMAGATGEPTTCEKKAVGVGASGGSGNGGSGDGGSGNAGATEATGRMVAAAKKALEDAGKAAAAQEKAGKAGTAAKNAADTATTLSDKAADAQKALAAAKTAAEETTADAATAETAADAALQKAKDSLDKAARKAADAAAAAAASESGVGA